MNIMPITTTAWEVWKYGVISGQYFPIELNTERYGVLGIQSEYRKIRTRNNSVFGHFLRSVPLSFRINLKDTFSHISKNSLGLYLSSKYLLNFFSNLYYMSPWLGKIFTNSWCSDRKLTCEPITWIKIFYIRVSQMEVFCFESICIFV